MGEGEVFGGKTAGLKQRNGQGIAQYQGGSGRGGRCQVQRTSFLGDAGIKVGLSGFSQR
ncbi:hypothetical protein D3C84_1160510 [compost metagenome]